MSASKAFAFSLAILLGAGQASAQGVMYDEPIDTGSDSSGSISGAAPIGSAGGYFWAQGDFGERPGVPGNYATIGAFAPLDFLGADQQFFIDGNMMINDSTEMGLNVGLGYRRLFDSIGIVGVNSFYTLDQSQNGFSYSRSSFGAEWLNDYFQLTGNLYVPFDSSENNIGPVILTKDALFLNNNLAFRNIQNAETPLKGADIEVGVPIPGADWLSVHGGAYLWDGKNSEEVKGTRARVQADLTNVLLNLSFSKDDMYGSQVNLAATYFFGAHAPSYAPRSKDLYDRMNDRTRRSNRIETREIVVRPIELAINPDTGLAYTFTHVDNTAAAGGDGTTELRLNNLGLASGTGSDIILVHRGTTTLGTPLTAGAGLVMADNQRLFGEGCPTFIDVANRPGAPCPLPGWATTGTNPFVAGGAGVNIITLADNNTVSGLNMVTGVGGNAIVGNGIQDFTLTKLNRDISPPTTTGAGGGIVLNNATGTGVIDDFGFNIPSAVGPNGIAITNTNTAPLNVSITNGRYLNGGENGILLSGNNADISATINNVLNSGSSTGLRLNATNTGDVLANVTNSQFNNAVGAAPGTGDGLMVTANGGDARLNISNSTATNATRNGLTLDAVNGGQATASVNTLNLSNAGVDALFANADDSRINLTATGVNGTGADDDGLDFRLTNGSQLSAAITNSNLSGAGDDGVVGLLNTGSNAVLQINNTSLANAGGNGLFVTTSGTSQFVGSLTDSSLDNATENGVRLDTAGTSRSTLTLDNSDATNAGQNGLVATTVGNSRTDLVLIDQAFDGAGQDAINLAATTDSLILVSGNNVSGAGAGDDGLQISADDARIGLTWINTGSFAGATDDGINFVGINGSNIGIGISGSPSSFDGAGGDGISGSLNNSTGTMVLSDVTFQNAGGEGIGITAIDSTFNGSITDGSFNNAGSNGARLTLSNSTGNLVLNNTDLFNAGGDALVVSAINGSGSTVSLLNGISLDSAGDDAIDVNVTDSTALVVGSGVSGNNATDDAIHASSDNGEVGILLANAGSFTAPGGDGIDFSGINSSTLNIQVAGFPAVSSFDNAGANGVIGTLDNSTATLGLSNTSFDNATLEGLGVTANNGSLFEGTVVNGSFENAGGNAIRMTLDDSNGSLILSTVDASGAGGHGVTVTSANNSAATLGLLNGVSLDDATLDAINIAASNSSSVGGVGTGVSGANAGDDGIDLSATTGSAIQLTLNQTGSFANAGGDGIVTSAVDGSLVDLTVSGPGASFNGATGFGARVTATNGSAGILDLNGVTVQNAGLDAIQGTANTNSLVRMDLTNVALDNAGDDAFDLLASNSSLLEVVGNGVSGPNATDDALHAEALTASRVDVNLSATGSFISAGDDGIDFIGTAGSSVNLVVSGAPSSFDGAGDNGVIGVLTDSAGTLNLTNTTFRNAGTDGLHLDLTNSTLTGAVVGSDFSRPGPAPAGDDGLELLLDNSNMTLNFTGTPVDNAGDDAIHIEAINGSLLNTKFTGGSLVNAGGDMTDITFAGGSVVNFNLDPVATGANQNGLRFTGTTGGVLNADISDSPMSIASDVVGQNGVLGTLNDATANLRLTNSDISNATLDGINVNAQNGSIFNATITNSQVSNAGGDGLELTLIDSQSSITFDNSDLNSAGGDGIRVNGTNSTFNLNLSNGINIDDATGDAMEFVAGNSTFTLNGNAGVTANNAGGDALRIIATNASTVTGVFNDLDLDNATANAIDLQATDSTINVQGRGLTTGDSAGDDAIRMAGVNSNVTLHLFNAGSFANAGGDGVDISGNNSQVGFRFSGAAPGAANLSGADDNGIVANLINNSVGQFIVDDFQIQNSGLNGINLGLIDSNIVNSTFTNGQVDNNGQDGVVGNRSGLRIVADTGSNIGTRAGQIPGLTFNGVSFQNDATNPRPQQHGLDISVDGDSFVGANFIGADIRNNDGDGVLLDVNPNATPSDTSLAVLNFSNTFVNTNWGDGMHITATNGTDDATPPQLSGAIINFADGEINDNGDFINTPATGVVGNGVGDGIDATANGDNTVAGNTQITLNLTNADITGNEEDALNSSISNGGSVNINLNGGSIGGGINVPCADGPLAYVEFTLNGTSVVSSSQLILCAKNGGTLNATVSQIDFSNNDGQGIILLAESGGDINANLTHIDVRNNGNNTLTPINPDVNPPITTVTGAIQGLVTGGGSTIDLIMDEMVVVNNQQGGLDLSVENGGVLNATITDSNFSDNGASGLFDAIRIDVDGAGSTANVGLSNILANNATDDGLDFATTAGGTFNLTMSTVDAIGAGDDGFSFTLDNSTGSIDSIGLDIDDADGRAVNLLADNGSSLTVTNFDNVTGRNAGEEGLNLDVLNGSTLTAFNSQTLNFADSGRLVPALNGVDILVANSSTTPVIVLNDINADNAGGRGLLVTATDPTVSLAGLTVNGGSFAGAGDTGVEINIANQAIPTTVQLTNVNASNAGDYGVQLNINNVTGGQTDVILNGVVANNAAGDDGLELNIIGLGATDSTQIAISGGSSFNNAANEGVDINLDGAAGSFAELIFSGVSANDATNDGINISPTGGLDLYVGDFRNVSATNAGGDGLELIANSPSGLRLFDANNVNVSGAGDDGVLMQAFGPQSGPAIISFDTLNASNAGGSGVNIDLVDAPGASSVSLTDVNASGAQTGDGVSILAAMSNTGDSTAISLDTVDVSNADVDGLNIRLFGNGTPGDTTSAISLDGLTATGATEDGIDLGIDLGVTATVAQFDNVVATGNRENGIQIDVEGGSVLTQFIADGIDLSNNALSGIGFDGLDIQVHDAGSSASFDLSNLTIDNSGGRGIDLDIYDGGDLTFNVDTASIANSGIGGIDINVGMIDENHNAVPTAAGPGTFTSTLTDVTIQNSGATPLNQADGLNIDVDGAGSVASLTLDHVLSNNNDQDGFDINVDNGADGTFVVNNATTGNSNAGTGFEFTADGAATTVSLTSTAGILGDNTFNNNFGDALTPLDGPGVSVILTNGVTATNLVIGASATGNDGDGLQVIANDGTGVTINNFGISGTALQVDNNAGNGLLVDFFAVNGVNAFDLTNVSVTGNALDQIHAEFRSMTMDHITLENVTATGIGAGTGDGIDITLLDTTLTNPGYAFTADGVVSTNNGGFGLNLNVDEAGVPNAIQTAGITNGLITASEFANNGAAGVRMTFGGDSVNNFDILLNTAGFHDNAQEGILIQVQDAATFQIGEANSILNTNLILPGRSMYENQITDNGGIGFHVVASEPLDVNLITPDLVGPRVVLHLGDPDRNPNVITGNTDAAMAIEMSGDATGQFTINSSILSETVNGANANFNGDGLAFRMTDFASLESLTIDGATSTLDINDNAGSGLVTNISRFSELGTTSRLTVLNSTIERNGLHGIDIQRNDNALYGPDANNNAIIIGSANNGNLVRDNQQNGLNLVLGNAPGGILPFDIDVTDNVFERNLNGVFLNGTGNAQMVGNISDNDFDANRQDGIQVVLENNAAIGDPRLANNPGLIPFLFEGNQILNSVRDGIRFDTNFTNEAGLFGAGAYANVLITESANFLDGFGDPVRTLIDGNGVHGVHIIDNSDFVAGVGVAVTRQNTYQIINSDITNNTVDGIHVNVANNAGIRDFNNGINLIVGDPNNADQRDVQINNNGDDGIDLELADSDSITNIIRIAQTTLAFNGATGDATGGNGIETDVLSSGSMNMSLETLDIMNNADDGMRFDISTTRASATKSQVGTAATVNAVTLVEMYGVDSSQNGGRGLNAIMTHDRILSGAASTSVFNIGRGDRTVDPISPDPRQTTFVNRFNGNAREGVVFDMQATSLDQDTVAANPFPHSAQTDINDDVFVDVNLPQNAANLNAGLDRPSTAHLLVSNGSLHDDLGNVPPQPSVAETRIHQVSTINFIHNEVSNNGTNFEDGIAFGIGAMTRLNATIAGNSFGGNVGDDIRVYPQRSSELNPPNSFNDTANDGAHSYLVHDPVAYADLVFGSVDTNLDGTPDTTFGNGRNAAATTAASDAVAKGEQIAILTFGTSQTSQITEDGVYSNNDPITGAGRPVRLAGQVQINGIFDDETINDFFENGVQQNIDNQFLFFLQNLATQNPDPLFP